MSIEQTGLPAKSYTLIKSLRHRVPQWGTWTLLGLHHSIDRNRAWFRVYVTLGVVVDLIHCYLARGGFGLDFFKEVVPSAIALVSAYPLLSWAREQHDKNTHRVFPKLVTLGAVLTSVVAVTIPVLPPCDLLGASLVATLLALGLATALMVVIVVFPATAFHPDLAHVGMFQRFTLLLEFFSGGLLFTIGAQQLLLWPETIAGPQPLRPPAYFKQIVSPDVPSEFVADVWLDGLATVLTLFILLLAVFGLYLQLAFRQRRGSYLAIPREAFKLLWANLRYRLFWKGTKTWPSPPRPHSFEQVKDAEGRAALEDFLLSSSFAAVSLAFGLWVPQAVPGGMSSLSLNRFLADVGQAGLSGAINWSGLLAFLALVLFLAGGIDIWLRAIEVAGHRGSLYTFGLWVGTLPLYWLTTLVAVVGIADFVSFSDSLFPRDVLLGAQNTFALWYRSALGAVTLLVAIGQSRQISRGSSTPRVSRYGLATVALFVLLSFAVNGLGSQGDPDTFARFSAIMITLVSVGTLFWEIPRRRRVPGVRPHGAQLVASSSVALAPLLFSKRINSITWSENGYAELTVRNVGISPEPLQLRLYTLGSEDEVAFEAISKPHARLRGSFEFVLTDLRTAIRIISAYRDKRYRHNARYRIISIVAAVPWRHLLVTRGGEEEQPQTMVLDAGYLRFTPPYPPPSDPEAPSSEIPSQCCPASLATVAYYAAHHTDGAIGAYLAEPFCTWLARQPGLKLETVSRRLVTYVLLARDDDRTVPAVPYNWRRTLCEIIHEGQLTARENQSVVNHAQLHDVQSFLQKAIGSRVQLHPDDIQLAICRSRFEPTFVSDKRANYRLVIRELCCARFIAKAQETQFLVDLEASDDTGQTVERAIIVPWEPITDDNNPEDERFFRWSSGVDTGERGRYTIDPELNSHLHNIAVVALPDRPGELARLLGSLLKDEDGEVDLALLASANLGDIVLVYIINRKDLPRGSKLKSKQNLGKPLKSSPTAGEWIARLRQRNEPFDAFEVRAFMVPVVHKAGSLLTMIKQMMARAGSSGVNVEQAYAFPVSKKRAIALLVSKGSDWQRMYRALSGDSFALAQEEEDVEMEVRSTEVCLKGWLPFQRHLQYIVFDISVEPGTRVNFKCEELATWTPTWGSIEEWVAEVRFNEIRLLIPTALAWQITALGWTSKVGKPGRWLKQKLQGTLPGIAGLEEYKRLDQWSAVIRVRDDSNNHAAEDCVQPAASA